MFIHTFIQIAFLWPVLKPLTCLTQISARYYMSHILISLNVSSRMSYLEKLLSICAKFLFTSKLCTMCMYHIFYYGNKSPKKSTCYWEMCEVLLYRSILYQYIYTSRLRSGTYMYMYYTYTFLLRWKKIILMCNLIFNPYSTMT